MNTMSHKGFHARIEFDAEDGLLVGHLAGINDLVGFHAETVQDLRTAFEEAVDDYLATCARIGKAPESAYSGELTLRIAPDVHAEAALAAQLSGLSLDQWSERVIHSAAEDSLKSRTRSPQEVA